MQDDTLLTPEEVQKELRLKRSKVYELIRTGELPHVDLGYRTKRVRRSDLDAYIKQKYRGSDE